MGEHYSAVTEPDTDAHTEPNAIGIALQPSVFVARSVADVDVCLSDRQRDTEIKVEAFVPSACLKGWVLGTSTSTFVGS